MVLQKGEYSYIAAADCTGHGVPESMMSLIGYLLMNDITNHDGYISTADLLDHLNKGIVKTLKQEQDKKAADGMDVALCRIHQPSNSIQFSGAHRPLYHFKDGEVLQYKGDKFPIGGYHHIGKTKFTNHEVTYAEGESVYLFSEWTTRSVWRRFRQKNLAPKRIRQLIQDQEIRVFQKLKTVLSQNSKLGKVTKNRWMTY